MRISRRFRRIARRAQSVAATLAISLSVHVFMTHSSFLTGPTSTGPDLGAGAAASAPGVPGEAPATARRWRGGVVAAPEATTSADDLSQRSLDLVRRTLEPASELPIPLTVPPPLSN